MTQNRKQIENGKKSKSVSRRLYLFVYLFFFVCSFVRSLQLINIYVKLENSLVQVRYKYCHFARKDEMSENEREKKIDIFLCCQVKHDIPLVINGDHTFIYEIETKRQSVLHCHSMWHEMQSQTRSQSDNIFSDSVFVHALTIASPILVTFWQIIFSNALPQSKWFVFVFWRGTVSCFCESNYRI